MAIGWLCALPPLREKEDARTGHGAFHWIAGLYPGHVGYWGMTNSVMDWAGKV
jgi:hypothetical protein